MWGRWGADGVGRWGQGRWGQRPRFLPYPSYSRGVPPYNSGIPLRVFRRNSSPDSFATPPAPGPPRHPSPHHLTRPLPLNSIRPCRRRPSLLPTPQRRLPSPRRRQPECPATSTASPSPAPGLCRPRHPRAPPPRRPLMTGTLRLRAHGRRSFLGRYVAGGLKFGPRPLRRAIGVLKMVLRSSSPEGATMPRPPGIVPSRESIPGEWLTLRRPKRPKPGKLIILWIAPRTCPNDLAPKIQGTNPATPTKQKPESRQVRSRREPGQKRRIGHSDTVPPTVSQYPSERAPARQ